MRRRWFFALSLLVGVALLGGFFWWQWANNAPAVSKSTKVFVIRKGESVGSIAFRLKEENLIKSSFAFKLLVLAKDFEKKIQAGSFKLPQGLSLEELLSQLTHGTSDSWITFLEGWRSEQFAAELIEKGFNIEFENWKLKTENSKHEGYLFPDTYLFPREATAGAIIKTLRDTLDKKITPEIRKRISQKGLTLHQALTLASLVEREVRADQDRPIIAGIIIKRWQNDWPLQIDATVQYALASHRCLRKEASCDWWPQNLTRQDLRIDSPYNTYEYQGLPPGPICSPSLASIKAVASSLASPYWFYISDPTGKTHYARTVEEHNQNIAKYLKK
jgi:UPF0755 protein